jgi:hypothetical protein
MEIHLVIYKDVINMEFEILHAYLNKNEAQSMLDRYIQRDNVSGYDIETMTTENGLNSKLITWQELNHESN